MQKLFVKALGVAVVLLLLGYLVTQADAAKGVPGSQEFAFGATLYIDQSSSLDSAITLAADLRPDWLYVPVDWSQTFSTPEQADWENLDKVMRVASQGEISVAISLTDSPDWALTAQGPDPALTAQVALSIARRYPGQVQALELFPRANTRQGWGSSADPAAYLKLVQTVRQAFQAEGIQAIFIGAGLQPLSSSPAEGDMNDLVFLQGLYDNGSRDWMQVVSIQYIDLTGEPLSAPSDGEYRMLRHYEQIRKVMVANGHLNGLLWITQLNLPDGQINSADAAYQNLDQQAEWLRRAYMQLRSQLYMGTAVLQSLNAPADNQGMAVMLQNDGTQHPFLPALKSIVSQKTLLVPFEMPGRPKDGGLNKLR